MQYLSLSENQYYNQCEPLVESLGFVLIELCINRRPDVWQIRMVIAKQAETPDDTAAIGIDDCTKVHRLLQPRLEALLETQDLYMEVTSPGLERLIKNAAEFPLLINRSVKLWCTDVSDWVYGVITVADTEKLTLQRNSDGSAIDIPYEVIAKAKLSYSREVEK